jgi:hypothetical protein
MFIYIKFFLFLILFTFYYKKNLLGHAMRILSKNKAIILNLNQLN